MRLLLPLLLSLTALTAGNLSNRRAPGFSLPDSKQVQHDPQDYRGKILLIDFMQTTCPHCAMFSTVLEEVKAKYKGKVEVVSVVTNPDTYDAVQKYIAAHKVTAPILFDCGQVIASYMKITPANPNVVFPHVFLIDTNGMIKNDFEYSNANASVFEGKGLYAELDKMVK